MTSSDPVALATELTMHAARLVRLVRRSARPPAGFQVLSILDQRGPAGIAALAGDYGCSQPTMSGLVAGLVDRGWVTKQPDPADARATLVTMTDTGRQVLADLRGEFGRFVADRLAAAGPVDPADVTTTVQLLRLLTAAGEAGSE